MENDIPHGRFGALLLSLCPVIFSRVFILRR